MPSVRRTEPRQAPSAAAVVGTSRQLAATLRTGDHRLDDRTLQRLYGIGAPTPAAREAIARELERAGLEVVGPRGRSPVVVRQRDPAASDGLRVAGAGGRRRTATLAGALVVVVAALVAGTTIPRGGDDPVPTTSTAAAAAPVPYQRQPAYLQARDAARSDAYVRALTLVRPLGADATADVGRIAAGRLAERADDALSSGDRERARGLLRRASAFPDVAEVRAQRARLERLDAAAQRRARTRARARARARAAARTTTTPGATTPATPAVP